MNTVRGVVMFWFQSTQLLVLVLYTLNIHYTFRPSRLCRVHYIDCYLLRYNGQRLHLMHYEVLRSDVRTQHACFVKILNLYQIMQMFLFDCYETFLYEMRIHFLC